MSRPAPPPARNISVTITDEDAPAFRYTDVDPGIYSEGRSTEVVAAGITEARHLAELLCRSERELWAERVRFCHSASLADVAPA